MNLEEKLNNLERQRAEAEARLYAIMGAIEFCSSLIAEQNAPEGKENVNGNKEKT